jgi:hypothetical protein
MIDKPLNIPILKKAGSFAENKDFARDIRQREIIPALEKGRTVILNFEGVESTTQSFIHALISDLLRKFGPEILDRLMFQKCNETIQKIIHIVVDYMQQSD